MALIGFRDAVRSVMQRQLGGVSGFYARLMPRSQVPGRRTVDEVLKSYRTSPWLHQVTGIIGDAAGAQSLTLERTTRNGKGFNSRYMKRQVHSKRTKKLRKDWAKAENTSIEPVFEHPALNILENPNPWMTGAQLRAVTVKHLALVGESFWRLDYLEGFGTPAAIYPIPPSWVTGVPSAEGDFFEMRIPGSGGRERIPSEQMLWFRRLDPANPLGRGAGAGEAVGDELDTDAYAAAMTKAFFHNRAIPDAIIGIEGAEDYRLEEIRERWMQKMRGMWRAYQPHFLGGKVSVQQLQSSFMDMQLIDLRQFERESFRTMWGVPAEKLGLTQNSNRAAAVQSETTFANVLIPYLDLMTGVLQNHFIPLYGDDGLVLGYESPMPSDDELQLAYVQTASWAATRGELRERMGFVSRGEEDDVHMVPAGFIPMAPDGTELGFGDIEEQEGIAA